ncbi:acetyl-CoA carboxylase [Pseudoscourfieldia marina]
MQHLQSLMDMGFDQKACLAALATHPDDLSRAVDHLFTVGATPDAADNNNNTNNDDNMNVRDANDRTWGTSGNFGADGLGEDATTSSQAFPQEWNNVKHKYYVDKQGITFHCVADALERAKHVLNPEPDDAPGCSQPGCSIDEPQYTSQKQEVLTNVFRILKACMQIIAHRMHDTADATLAEEAMSLLRRDSTWYLGKREQRTYNSLESLDDDAAADDDLEDDANNNNNKNNAVVANADTDDDDVDETGVQRERSIGAKSIAAARAAARIRWKGEMRHHRQITQLAIMLDVPNAALAIGNDKLRQASESADIDSLMTCVSILRVLYADPALLSGPGPGGASQQSAIETKAFELLEGTLNAMASMPWMPFTKVEKVVDLLRSPSEAHTKEVEAQFAESWKRGQLAACNDAAGLQSMLRFPVEMTFRDVAYTVDVTRKSQDSYSLKIRGASSQDGIVCRARERSDGTLIITPMGAQRAFQVVGLEEPLGLRLVLDGQTFLLPNQNDPSELRTDVTGKLIRFLKKDGDEIQQGKPYAGVESMKMVMQLVASESGKITLKKPPGSVIEAGDLLAGLELEDPSKVKRATPFSGTFEPKGIMPSDGNIWQPDFSMMSMDGDMEEDKQVALDAAVEAMDLLLDGYEHDVESTVQQFITGLQEFVASQVELNGTEKWEMAMEYVGRVVSRYLAVEARFGNTSPEGAVAELVQAHAKDSPATITSAVLARSQVARRSDAIASLLRQLPSLPAQVMQSGPVSWQGDFAPISEDVKSDLERLSRLRRPEHGSVALAAANILLEKKLPSVDQRLEELRDLLAGKSAYKSSSGIEIAAGDLDALVGSPLLAVDLLPQLFGDDDAKVREAAITVFVKRMYRSHKVHGVEIDEVAGLPVAKFKFQYDTPPLESPMRFGMLAVASVMSDFEAKMPQLLERYQELQSDVKSDGESEHGPINVLHLACTDEKATLAADDESAACAEAISASVKSMGEACGLKYVNVIAHESKQLPRYYTYTAAKEYAEDPLYRGCRPTLAHLLELSRLQNYELTRIPTFNRDLYIYSGAVTDGSRQMPQLLLRRITHSKDVMDGGLERIMTKALDGLDLAVLDPRGNTCSSSRIYVNSIPEIAADCGNAVATARELSNRIADFVSQNAARLLKLKVDEIEFKVRIKSVGEVVPVRLMASSLSGQWLKMDIFREYLNPVTGAATRFCTYGSEDASQPEVCFLDPYPIPGNVYRKRTAARRIGSTYIYDFLGIFETSVVSSWVQRLAQRTTHEVKVKGPQMGQRYVRHNTEWFVVLRLGTEPGTYDIRMEADNSIRYDEPVTWQDSATHMEYQTRTALKREDILRWIETEGIIEDLFGKKIHHRLLEKDGAAMDLFDWMAFGAGCGRGGNDADCEFNPPSGITADHCLILLRALQTCHVDEKAGVIRFMLRYVTSHSPSKRHFALGWIKRLAQRTTHEVKVKGPQMGQRYVRHNTEWFVVLRLGTEPGTYDIRMEADNSIRYDEPVTCQDSATHMEYQTRTALKREDILRWIETEGIIEDLFGKRSTIACSRRMARQWISSTGWRSARAAAEVATTPTASLIRPVGSPPITA